jgi:hypothetical protein
MDDGGKALYLSSFPPIIAGHDLNACGTRGKRMPDFPRTILPFNQRIKKLDILSLALTSVWTGKIAQ